MLAKRTRFLSVRSWTVLIALILGMFVLPAVHAQSRAPLAPAAQPTPAIQVPPDYPGDPGDPGTPDLYNDARIVGQSVPGQMVAGWGYTVSVTLYNNGTTTWSRAENYTLMSYEPFNGWSWGPSRIPLPVDYVAPGQSATFTFEVRAPETPGTYTFQWGMQREGYGSFGTTAAVVNINVIPPPNNAQPVGQSAPTQMEAGKAYNVSVTMYNNGGTTWSRALDYTLMSYAPFNGLTWGFNRVSLPFDNVAPGQSATFMFQVTAPSTTGAYIFQWGMQRERYGEFGPATEPLTINVVAPAPSLGNVTFIHTDGLGSPVARTDGAGNLISRTYYEPYGNTAAGAQSTIGFTGHVNDVDTGLTYMQQRYYDPVAGRFLSIDPILTDTGAGTGFNRYSYVLNNPYKNIDPDGRQERAAEGLSDQYKKDAEAGKTKEYMPLVPVAGAIAAAPVVATVVVVGAAATTSVGAVASSIRMAIADRARKAAKAEILNMRKAPELKEIFGWGNGPEGATKAIAELDQSAMTRIQGSMSRKEVEAVENFIKMQRPLVEAGIQRLHG